ncbi:MAG TPA: hypothetical protein H9894_05310 [Candidatus Desulfovibrio intestinipullorum]|uniref:Uncharacterized protein n=1 Tax=Candidatus Desulfovibrio intestinipullorum TaxID=2838536 RepID=A0A9D1TPZ8_9BACT|nr:hypothetical protein [Candidatus Desulfovibrio intestinipullorum]
MTIFTLQVKIDIFFVQLFAIFCFYFCDFFHHQELDSTRATRAQVMFRPSAPQETARQLQAPLQAEGRREVSSGVRKSFGLAARVKPAVL